MKLQIVLGSSLALGLVTLGVAMAAQSLPPDLPPIANHDWNQGMLFIRNPPANEKPPADCIWLTPRETSPLITVRGVLYMRSFMGPTGLGETPSREVVPILKLEKPLNVCSRRAVFRTGSGVITSPTTYWENVPALEIEFLSESPPPTTAAYYRAWRRYKPYSHYSKLEITGRLLNSGSAPLAWGINVSKICGVANGKLEDCRSKLPPLAEN